MYPALHFVNYLSDLPHLHKVDPFYFKAVKILSLRIFLYHTEVFIFLSFYLS